jgi:hypothetical protein
MGGKRIRTTPVPCHLRLTACFRPSTATGSERKMTSPKTWVSAFAGSEMRIVVRENVVRKRDLPCLVLGVRSNDGDLAAGPTEVVVRGGCQTKQGARLADLDCFFRNDFQLAVFGRNQSAVRSRRMVNSMAPSGISRHLSTSLI